MMNGDLTALIELSKPRHKFNAPNIKRIISQSQSSHLSARDYSHEFAQEIAPLLAQTIKDKLHELDMDRYKFIVQVDIGERKDQGVRIASRCLFDPEVDGVASETFTSESLFCSASVFGIYLY